MQEVSFVTFRLLTLIRTLSSAEILPVSKLRLRLVSYVDQQSLRGNDPTRPLESIRVLVETTRQTTYSKRKKGRKKNKFLFAYL
ncbi:hypothetical protein BJX64DRAFT_106748 [Aspergillus heterothallicus]